MKRIAVYCGSSKGTNRIYRDQVQMLGKYLAKKKIEIIYGGGKVGLMGILANAALSEGGKVTGVIPEFLHVREVAHDNLTRMFPVASMHQRKAMIDNMSDGVIALPGGFGTLDELFEMLTWGQLGLHQKPVGIFNINGFFTHVINAIDNMVHEGFLNNTNREMVLISDDIEELLTMMRNYSAPSIPKWIDLQ